MAEESVDPELQALTERIATVRAAIEEEQAARTAIERTQAPGEDEPEQAVAALREEVTAARARLRELEGRPRRPGTSLKASREAAARRGMYIMGAVVAFPGVVTLGAMLWVSPDDALDNIGLLVFASPLLIGLGLTARARFANYDEKRDDLDGDFLP